VQVDAAVGAECVSERVMDARRMRSAAQQETRPAQRNPGAGRVRGMRAVGWRGTVYLERLGLTHESTQRPSISLSATAQN
jgi:hypothetical protein